MSEAILVIAMGDALGKNSEASFIHASQRWNVPLVLFHGNSERPSPLHPACWKTMAFELVLSAERLMVLDADTVIHSLCPNPFKGFPAEKLTVVNDRQTHCPARAKAETDEWEIVTGRRWVPEKYFNSGVILASRSNHLNLFWAASKLCHGFPHLCWHDQTPFNIVCETYFNLNYVEETWNFQNPAGRVTDWPRMSKNIYHFPGNPARQKQIEEVQWK